MKASIRDLIGKTISGIVVKQGGPVRQQIFLLFSDDTYFEIYSNDGLNYSGAVCSGTADEVRAYMGDAQRIVIDATSLEGDEGERRRSAA